MQSFDLELGIGKVTIELLGYDKYLILQEGRKIGIIYPVDHHGERIWRCDDALEFDYIQYVGEKIDEKIGQD